MATELKPCPFCGNNAKLKQFTSGCLKKTKVFYVECCVCRNQTKVELDMDHAIDAWNKRYFHKAIPTVLELDGREVVRCKDCENWMYEYDDVGLCVTDVPDIDGVQRHAYDFCSYGERKTDV